MSDDAPLLEHLSRVSPWSGEQVSHLAEEVLAFYGESVEEFVRRRHGELLRCGLHNREIWPRIQQEMTQRRFRASALSLRQLRRLVYG